MGAPQRHIWLWHLPASTVRAHRGHVEPKVSRHVRCGPPLRRWVRLRAHSRESSRAPVERPQGCGESRHFLLTETCSSGHDHRMSAPLFANKPEHCPYGHSLARGMPQKISWPPCICDPAREAAKHGRGMGHVTLWCGTCSAEDHRDTRFYEPPHQVGHNRPLSGWATRPDALAPRKRRPGRQPQPRGDLLSQL